MSLELESLVTTEFPSLSTGPTESLSTARKWLKTCRTEHSSCCRAGTHPESHWRPIRLIHLGEGLLPMARLCERLNVSYEAKSCQGQISYTDLAKSHGYCIQISFLMSIFGGAFSCRLPSAVRRQHSLHFYSYECILSSSLHPLASVSKEYQ